MIFDFPFKIRGFGDALITVEVTRIEPIQGAESDWDHYGYEHIDSVFCGEVELDEQYCKSIGLTDEYIFRMLDIHIETQKELLWNDE